MTELLLTAARRLGVATEVSAGPGGDLPGLSIWARWPRHPYEIAQDVLDAVIRTELDASVAPLGGTPLWRARHGSWSHIGRFEDAVGQLACHVTDAAKTPRAFNDRAAGPPSRRPHRPQAPR